MFFSLDLTVGAVYVPLIIQSVISNVCSISTEIPAFPGVIKLPVDGGCVDIGVDYFSC